MKDLLEFFKLANDNGIDIFFVLAGILLIVLYIIDKVGVWISVPYDRRRMALATGIVFLVIGTLLSMAGDSGAPAIAEVTPTQTETRNPGPEPGPDYTVTIAATETPTSVPASPTPEIVTPSPEPTRTQDNTIPVTGNREADLLARNILLSGDPANLQERRGWLMTDPAYHALADNTIALVGDHRLINAIHLDNLNGVFIQNVAPGASNLPKEMYANADQLRLAIEETWELNYPAVDSFEQMLMPASLIQGAGNIPQGGLIGTDLISSPIRLSANGEGAAQEYRDFNRYLLQGKNWVAVTLDLHGFMLDNRGDADAIIIDQPPGGAWHYAKLSQYVRNGYDGEQTVYIPIEDFNQDGGLLDSSSPVGTLHFRIWTEEKPFTIDITRVVAYYSAR